MAANAQIPIIDISANGADQAGVARRLVDAAAEHGFIYIRNTGKDISTDLIQRTFELVSIRRASRCELDFLLLIADFVPASPGLCSSRPLRTSSDVAFKRITRVGRACTRRPWIPSRSV